MSLALLCGLLVSAGTATLQPSPATANGIVLGAGNVVAALPTGALASYSPAGSRQDTLSTGTGAVQTGMCMDGAGNLYATDWNQGVMTKFDGNGTIVVQNWGGASTFAANFDYPYSCAVDGSGHVWVGTTKGASGPGGSLYKFDLAGSLITTVSLLSHGTNSYDGINSIQFGADQCTLYYTSFTPKSVSHAFPAPPAEASTIFRWNACTGTQLTPLASSGLPTNCAALSILANGQVLAACASQVVLVNTNGTVAGSYTLSGKADLDALSLDPGGSSFWVGDTATGTIAELALSNGAVQAQFSAGQSVDALAVVGAAGPTAPAIVGPNGPITPATNAGPRDPAVAHQCRVCRGGPVDTSTGAQYVSRADLSIPGRGLALRLGETYNSNFAAVPGPLGNGWSWSYGISLTNPDGTPLGASPSTVRLNQETGAQDLFTLSGATWSPVAARVDAALVHSGSTWTLTRRRTQTLRFDATGRLVAETDLNANTTSLAYPSASQIVITDPAMRTLTVTLDPAKSPPRVTQVADSSRTVSFGYDASGDLIDVTDIGGGHTSYGYEPAAPHRLVQERSPRYYAPGPLPALPATCADVPPANMTTSLYDTNGRVVCQWDPDGRRTTFSWTDDGLGDGLVTQSVVTDPKGNPTVYSYSAGELTSMTRGAGAAVGTWVYRYDPNTLGLVWSRDPNGHIGTASYDPAGNRLTRTDALGRTTTWTYNGFNEVATATPPKTYGAASVTTTYTYDEAAYASGVAGNLTTVSTPVRDEAGTNLGTAVVHYLHCAATPVPSACGAGISPAHPGDVTTMIDAGGFAWDYGYDAFGDTTSVTAPSTADNSDGGPRRNTTRSAYDTAKGWLTATMSGRYVLAHPTDTTCVPPAAGCTTLGHDAFGHVTTVIDGNGQVTTTHYDADQHLEWSKDANHAGATCSTAAASPGCSVNTIDPAGQLLTLTRADLSTVQTTYWPDGAVKDHIDGAGVSTHYDYDALGHLSARTDGKLRVTGYTYDPVGNLLATADPGVTGCGPASIALGCTVYTYDAADELRSVRYHDPGRTPDVTDQTYDANGVRSSMTEVHGVGTATSSWHHDSLGRLYSDTDTAGATVVYGYDLRSDLTTITYPGAGTVVRSFDPAGRMSDLADLATPANIVTYRYDADGHLASRSAPPTSAPLVDTTGFDNAGAPSSVSVTQGPDTLAAATYGRDPAGQVSSESDAGQLAGTHNYAYSALEQLCADSPTAVSACAQPPTFGYDGADNPTRLGATGQAFDAANQLCWAASAAPGPCASAPTAATSFVYDTRGNRTTRTPPAGSGPVSTYGYDQADRLVSATVPVAQSAFGKFTTLAPARILDTRAAYNTGSCPSPGSCATLTPANETTTLQVVGQGGVPATGVTAVVLNLTVTNPTSASFITAWPADGTQPDASNLNFTAGQTVANLVTVKLSTDGRIKLNNAFGSVDVIADVAGYYSDGTGAGGGRYTPLAPARILDTRAASNTGSCPAAGSCATLTPANETATLQVAGQGGVPATGVTAVVLNLTVTNPTSASFITAWPADGTQPNASNLNFVAGQTVANLVTVKLSADGRIKLNNAFGSVDVIADVAGYYSDVTGAGAGRYTPLAPARILDTRSASNTGSCPNPGTCTTLTPGSETATLQVSGQGGVPATGVTAVVLNLTVTNPTSASFITAWPADGTQPNASNVNFVAGQTVANLVTVKLSTDGRIKLNNAFGSVDVIADVAGWYDDGNDATHAPLSYGYTYDGDGRRMSKTGPGTTTNFVWDQASGPPLLLSEGTGSSATRYVYGPGGVPVERIDASGAVVWFHQDQLGSTRVITDASGAVVGTTTYGPLGSVAASTGQQSRLGFAGQYTDAETGFVYLRARYYDPATAQFLSRDPLEDATRSAYGYVGNNPLNGSDPTGLDENTASQTAALEAAMTLSEAVEEGPGLAGELAAVEGAAATCPEGTIGAGGGVAGGAGGVYEPLSGINPSGSTTNCVRCVAAARDTLNGTPTVAESSGLMSPDSVLGPRELVYPSESQVAEQLAAPGSHGIVQVPSQTQPSHMLTVLNDGGRIIYVDPQAGGLIVPAPSEIYGFWPGS